MARATDDALDALHGLMAESMTDELRRGLERARAPKLIPDPADPTGKSMIDNPNYEPLSAKLLGVIRAFLKDNGIDAPASSRRLSPLVEQLSQMEIEDDGALYQ